MFSPVAYMTQEEVNQTFATIIENVQTNVEFLRAVGRETILRYVFHMLVAGVTCLKHEGFREEREWRAIYSPVRAASPLITRSVETIAGVPQFVYHMPLDKSVSSDLAGLDLANIFDRLIIGPSSYPLVMREAFIEALSNIGVGDAINRVDISEIPVRT